MADLSSHTETLLRLLDRYGRPAIWRAITAATSSDPAEPQFPDPGQNQDQDRDQEQQQDDSYGELLRKVAADSALLEHFIKPDAARHKSKSMGAHLSDAQQFSGSVVGFFDADFPATLRHIPDPPLVLFVKGMSVASLSETSQLIAVVGSRKATQYGKAAAQALASYLAARGVVVVSGLALGIDAAAHRGALASRGKTIAVLGGGLDQIYPKAHTRMAEQLLELGGCLVSEYPPGVKPRPHHFLERNRLISGLCHSVVVVEAAQRSGALNTARWALEQGRDVWALPGSVHSLVSKGCHRLIQDGANVIAEWQDLLPDDEGERSAPITPLGGVAADVHAACCECAKTLDDLLLELDVEFSELLQIVGELELAGIVQATPLGYIAASHDSSQ